ncbi:MAG: hypothetical protein BWY15_00990 [Firmicutes bacterium ADurb.Bin193]|nr:MAG: hypothetical protein BWY15_00990 [Firmicutes bacterium ADurb.Bin193]
MTNKSAKRVVIINDIKSKNIEQAIFILRDDITEDCKSTIVKEANEIVQNYIRQVNVGQYRNVKAKHKWFKWR